MTTTARAAVLREAGKPLVLQEIELEDPRPFEVVVRLESVGVCRTDTHALREVSPPAILGHEGAGVVEATGSAVTKVAVGDKVLTTFASCGTCRRCRLAQVAYCERFRELNFSGGRGDGTTAAHICGEPVATHFLGQSVFASHAVVSERSVVAANPDWDLRPLAPFGCGFQTGAGAVLNSLRPPAGASIAVCGTGAVGLSAIAAAALTGCEPIVAVDMVAARLETARRPTPVKRWLRSCPAGSTMPWTRRVSPPCWPPPWER
jgi:aryl-alcohol dehydrogenase